MKMLYVPVLLLLVVAGPSSSDNVGWKSFFTESPEEFHDIPLQWEGMMHS